MKTSLCYLDRHNHVILRPQVMKSSNYEILETFVVEVSNEIHALEDKFSRQASPHIFDMIRGC